MSKQVILITGGAGFIGTNLAFDAVSRGYRVVIVDNLSRAGVSINLHMLLERDGIIFEYCDIRDEHSLCGVIKKYAKDLAAIFHLAAQVAVTTSVIDPRVDFEVNALGTFNVLEAVRKLCADVPTVYASTNKVYGNLEGLAISEGETRYEFKDLPQGVTEERPLDYHSPYGCSKGVADQYMIDYHRIYGLKTVSFRQSCIYGPYQMGLEDQGWLAWFIIATMFNRPLTLYGTGKQIRDVLFVGDLIDAYWKAVDNIGVTAGKAYNIGGGENRLSLLELLEHLHTLFGKEIIVQHSDKRPGDQPVFICDTSKATRDFGWSPTTSWSDGVALLYNWISDHESMLRKAGLW